MLLKVTRLDYNQTYQYAPSRVQAIVNTDDIQTVEPADGRGSGPFLTITFKNGVYWTIAGLTVEQFLERVAEPNKPRIIT